MITPAGRVDTATAQVDDPSDERYAEAAMSAVAQMRFVPAEFDGSEGAGADRDRGAVRGNGERGLARGLERVAARVTGITADTDTN